MKFQHIQGGDPEDAEIKKAVETCLNKLNSIFIELSLSYESKMGNGIGGDIAVLHLMQAAPHFCDVSDITLARLEKKKEEIEKKISELNDKETKSTSLFEELDQIEKAIHTCEANGIFTAASSGSKYWWNATFVNKLPKLGLRLLVCHEATHSLYMHPQRRGCRKPDLYNIAVDFKVNHLLMEDLKARKQSDVVALFEKNLGKFITLDEYVAFLKDPFNPPKKMAHCNPIHNAREKADNNYVHPGKDHVPLYYAAPELSDGLKRPENIYSLMYDSVPLCKLCGRWGVYEKPKEMKDIEKKLGLNKPCCIAHKHKRTDCCDHDHKECPFNNPNHCWECGCPDCMPQGNNSCSGSGLGGQTIDQHIDTDIGEDELAKRMADAEGLAKKYGYSAGYLNDELKRLQAPVMRWEDFILHQIQKKKQGVGRNKWSSPRIKPLFAGLYTPKKYDIDYKILVGIDCSGSMSGEDIARGVSQLQAIGTKASISICPWDTVVYWIDLVEIKKADVANLQKTKITGRGGTSVNALFAEYQEEVGEVDLIIVISDTYLGDEEVKNAKAPPKDTQTLWLQTAVNDGFKPRFGRIFNLANER